MMAEVAHEHAAAVRDNWADFGAIFRARALVGEAIPPEDYALAQRLRPMLTRRLLDGIAGVDALLMPGAMVPPGPLASLHPFYFMKDPIPNIVANYTGLPALAFPAGQTAEGLPIGLQILGPPDNEHRLLDIAEAFEMIEPLRYAARAPAPA